MTYVCTQHHTAVYPLDSHRTLKHYTPSCTGSVRNTILHRFLVHCLIYQVCPFPHTALCRSATHLNWLDSILASNHFHCTLFLVASVLKGMNWKSGSSAEKGTEDQSWHMTGLISLSVQGPLQHLHHNYTGTYVCKGVGTNQVIFLTQLM